MPRSSPTRRASVGEDRPLGAHVAGMADRRAQALKAPVGVRQRALLLGVALGREDDVGVLAEALGEEAAWATTVVARSRAASHPSRAGQVASGSVCSRYRAVSSPAPAAAAIAAASRRARRRREAGAGVGEHARLGKPAAVGDEGTTSSPAPSRPPTGSAARRGRAARRRLRRRAARDQSLAPEDRRCPRRACSVRTSGAGHRHRPPTSSRPRLRAAGPIEGGRQREQGRPRRRGGSAALRPRWRRGRRPGRGHRQLDSAAAHALADPQVEDRRVV